MSHWGRFQMGHFVPKNANLIGAGLDPPNNKYIK